MPNTQEDESVDIPEFEENQEVDLEAEQDDSYIDDNHMDLPGEDQRDQSTPQFKSKKPKKSLKKFIVTILLILAVVLIGFIAWKIVPSKNESTESSQPAPAESSQSPQSDSSQALGSSSLDEEYTSDFLRISLKHPSSWNVNEVDDAITIKSPDFKYTQSNGMEKDGFFKIYITKGSSENDGKYLGRGYAVVPSEKITYTEPASDQRQETFLSDFGLDTPDNFAYFVIQGNFDLKKGDTLGPTFASEPDAYFIAGGFSSSDQTDNLATNIMSASDYRTNEAYVTAIEIIKSLKLK